MIILFLIKFFLWRTKSLHNFIMNKNEHTNQQTILITPEHLENICSLFWYMKLKAHPNNLQTLCKNSLEKKKGFVHKVVSFCPFPLCGGLLEPTIHQFKKSPLPSFFFPFSLSHSLLCFSLLSASFCFSVLVCIFVCVFLFVPVLVLCFFLSLNKRVCGLFIKW